MYQSASLCTLLTVALSGGKVNSMQIYTPHDLIDENHKGTQAKLRKK